MERKQKEKWSDNNANEQIGKEYFEHTLVKDCL